MFREGENGALNSILLAVTLLCILSVPPCKMFLATSPVRHPLVHRYTAWLAAPLLLWARQNCGMFHDNSLWVENSNYPLFKKLKIVYLSTTTYKRVNLAGKLDLDHIHKSIQRPKFVRSPSYLHDRLIIGTSLITRSSPSYVRISNLFRSKPDALVIQYSICSAGYP
jgi:hypothetical protein